MACAGSYDESTSVTLQKLMAPPTPVETWVSQVAQSWSGFKSALYGDVPDAFDPRKRSAFDAANCLIRWMDLNYLVSQ